ncbi:MAG: methylated-DNA--[protein]-cysteine S-methyltransferase [Candidatus Bathyarchaeota archaeon]|nr:methylated-DNA--[protein]-cysteine S-methyltransferase [Candidatus Bathyarchaeota archaeon]
MVIYVKNLNGVWFGTACDNSRIFATAFAFDKNRLLRNLLRNLPFNVPFEYSEGVSSFAEQVLASLKDIYYGKDTPNNFHLFTDHLSNYARKVLRVVALIPVGYVASYGSVAKAAGGSPRSVGRIMASNPFPLIIPCHRVIASGFSLGGYGEGLQVKLKILSRERRGYSSEWEISINGETLYVFPVELLLSRHKEAYEAFPKRK